MLRLTLLSALLLSACGGSSPPGGDMQPIADLAVAGDVALPPQPPLAPGCTVEGQATSSGCIFNEVCNQTLACSLVCSGTDCGCLDPANPGAPAGPNLPQGSACDNLMDYRLLPFCSCFQ